jgi:serine/threonine protein kinase
VQKHEPKIIKDIPFYCFSINFNNNKLKKYYHLNETIVDNWISAIEKATNFRNINNFYSFSDSIGRGQFGLVIKGVNLKNNAKVAIKVLDKTQMNSNYDSLKNEIDILKISKHPNIVQFYDYFENANNIFIVMELISGGTLEEYLKSTNWKVSETTIRNIVRQLANGLYYLNQFGIIHRDIKMNNIMVNNIGELQVKIMDFGLSKILAPSDKAKESCGTLSFIAPEIIQKKPYNNLVDIWSLGILSYFIISKELPFDTESNNFKDICNTILTKKLVFFGEKWVNVSDEAKDFISRCLIRDPEKRIKIEEILCHQWIINEK